MQRIRILSIILLDTESTRQLSFKVLRVKDNQNCVTILNFPFLLFFFVESQTQSCNIITNYI